MLGIIEIFSKSYISTALSDAIVFAVLIVVLLVKPTGLLKENYREGVRGVDYEQNKKIKQVHTDKH